MTPSQTGKLCIFSVIDVYSQDIERIAATHLQGGG